LTEGADADAAADVLAGRLRDYPLYGSEASKLTDYVTFEQAAGTSAAGLPVALTVLCVDDPSVSEETGRLEAPTFFWLRLVAREDLLFLLTEPSGE